MRIQSMADLRVARSSNGTISRRLTIVALAGLMLGCVATQAALAETWAERLGFPADKKVVLLHATELGMCYETNVAGEQLVGDGLVRSAAAMAPCPWFGDLLPWCAEHPQADIGLALTLNCPSKDYRWKPTASQGLVASLTDPNGFFWTTPLQSMVNASAGDVEQELEAQIALAESSGLHPTHLTPFLGTLVTRPDLMEVYLRVARRHWIPAVVVELTPEQVERFAEAGYPLPDRVIQLMADYPLPKVDDLRFIPHGDTYDAKKQAFISMLHDLSPGITQIGFAPAVESDAIKQISPDWQQQAWETKLMADKDVRQVLEGKDFILTDWRDLMGRFQGSSGQAGE